MAGSTIKSQIAWWERSLVVPREPAPKPVKQPRVKETRGCERCGSSFAAHNARHRFCSQRCKYKSIRSVPGRNQRRKPLDRKPCAHCGTEFLAAWSSAKYCSAKCYGDMRYQSVSFDYKCVECGASFKSRLTKASCCSHECVRAVSRRAAIEYAKSNPAPRKHASRSDAYRVYDYQRRSAYDSPRAEVFSSEEIFERDGWLCQICGEEIDRNLVFPHPRSVSLDHIIPISRGGLHRRDNVQCAHFGCNSGKGNKLRCIEAASA